MWTHIITLAGKHEFIMRGARRETICKLTGRVCIHLHLAKYLEFLVEKDQWVVRLRLFLKGLATASGYLSPTSCCFLGVCFGVGGNSYEPEEKCTINYKISWKKLLAPCYWSEENIFSREHTSADWAFWQETIESLKFHFVVTKRPKEAMMGSWMISLFILWQNLAIFRFLRNPSFEQARCVFLVYLFQLQFVNQGSCLSPCQRSENGNVFW